MRAKGELVDRGYITVEKRRFRDANGDGRSQTDLIRLFVPSGTGATPLGGKNATYPPIKNATCKAVDVKENETLAESCVVGAPPPPASPSEAPREKMWTPEEYVPPDAAEKARIRAAMKARKESA